VNDANPRWQNAEGGSDGTDPSTYDPYYQQQPYGYDAYGRPVADPRAQQQAQQSQQAQQQTYADPYYGDPGQQTYGGGSPQGWIPQQPQQPYYEQGGTGRVPQQGGYGNGPQPGYDQGYGTGRQPPSYGSGQSQMYDTGRQQPLYDTGQQPVYDTGQQAPVYGTGQSQMYDTGGQQALYETGRQPVYDTGRQAPVRDTGQQPLYDTGQQPVYDTGRQAPVRETAGQPAGGDDGAGRARTGAAQGAGHGVGGDYHTEQFSFVDEESEESEEVIDWLKFTESRTERREEARRRGHNRTVGLVIVLVLALLGGAGYLWQAGKIPGLNQKKTAAADTGGGAQKRDVIVVHLLPVGGGPSATALLVDNATKGRGTTVLIPNSVLVSGDDGTQTTLDKAVAGGVGPTRDSLNTLLGTDIKGSWRLDSPYLELLVDSLGDISVNTDTTVKGTGKNSGKVLVPQGEQEDLTGQAAVAYATYKGPGESQNDQLSRFGQVMQAVLLKMPSDAAGATKTVQGLAQILDPSLNDKQLGASLAGLAELAKTGAYDTVTLPVQKDGTLSTQATGSVVKDVLGGTVKQSTGTSAQARVAIQDATGDPKSAGMAQAAILNGGTYAYVPGGKAAGTHDSSQVLYTDPARLAAAKDIAATLGLPATAVRKGTVPSTTDVLVVLGKDYKPATGD
jgi:anionic cell wall polymer biosynthesis LytR-Cps2A-Psr (LCP) family protein